MEEITKKTIPINKALMDVNTIGSKSTMKTLLAIIENPLTTAVKIASTVPSNSFFTERKYGLN